MPESVLSNIGSKITSFMKGLVTSPEPYDIVQRMPQSFKGVIIPLEEMVAFIEVNKNQIVMDINNAFKKHEIQPVTEEQFNDLIKYYIPERIKEDDVIKVKDGKVTYTELKKAIQDADNVSYIDSQLGKKIPKIFMMPKLPEDDSAKNYVLATVYHNNTRLRTH